jgi:CO dehydrogenase/acetyl-CoA synthase beta subunit
MRVYLTKRFYVEFERATICFEDRKRKVSECDAVKLESLERFLELYAEYLERRGEEEEELREEEEELLEESTLMEELGELEE